MLLTGLTRRGYYLLPISRRFASRVLFTNGEIAARDGQTDDRETPGVVNRQSGLVISAQLTIADSCDPPRYFSESSDRSQRSIAAANT